MNELALLPRLDGLALCAGIGGIELGLRLALGDAYRTVCYVEREAFAAATLVARMEDETLDEAPIWDDIATFDGTRWRGLVDIVSCGFPCQPFSAAGRKRGTEDERWIWPHIARVVAESEPEYVFLENVPGLVGHGLRVVWTDLRRLGYGVRAGYFSAADVGAPHRRERIFLLAYTDGGRQQGERLEELSGESGEPGRESHGHGDDGRELGKISDSEFYAIRHEPERGRGAARSSQSRNAEHRHLGEELADADREQRQGRAERAHEYQTWPPPPGWSGDWVGPEPRVRRVPSRPSDRVHRLRALGNAVVPLVAAHAFRTLWKEVSE